MSECVVRMKNPDDCLKCGVRHICNPYVDYWQQDTRKKPKPGQKGCLIICALPEGHGRLGDLDKLEGVVNMARIRVMRNGEDTNPYWECTDLILQAHTIVPAAERSETK